MLYMRIGQHILVIAVQDPSQHLAVDLVLSVHLRVFLIYPEKLNHVESGLRLV
jgi:hypothetical protein